MQRLKLGKLKIFLFLGILFNSCVLFRNNVSETYYSYHSYQKFRNTHLKINYIKLGKRKYDLEKDSLSIIFDDSISFFVKYRNETCLKGNTIKGISNLEKNIFLIPIHRLLYKYEGKHKLINLNDFRYNLAYLNKKDIEYKEKKDTINIAMKASIILYYADSMTIFNNKVSLYYQQDSLTGIFIR